MTLPELDLMNRIKYLRLKSIKQGSFFVVTATVFGKSIARLSSTDRDDAIRSLRDSILGGDSPVFLVSQSQKRRAKNVIDGDVVFNITLQKLETYINGNWV